MTQPKHTPAPWNVSKRKNAAGSAITSISACGYEVAGIRRPLKKELEKCGVRMASYEVDANARLMAAAPDYDIAAKAAIEALENDPQVRRAQKHELESECEKCRALDLLYAAREKAGTILKGGENAS